MTRSRALLLDLADSRSRDVVVSVSKFTVDSVVVLAPVSDGHRPIAVTEFEMAEQDRER